MTIRSILKTACLFLNKQNLCEKIDLPDLTDVDEVDKNEIAFLLKCLNLVYQEIATDYIPLLHKENIQVVDNKILFTDLEKKFFEVVSIKDENGCKVKFKTYPNYIEVNKNQVDIVYKYTPASLDTLISTIENFSNKVSEITFAFGIAMEYFFINGLHEDALIWEKRFKDALFIRSGKKSCIKLPVRRWF